MAVDAVEATESLPKEAGLVGLDGRINTTPSPLVNRADRLRLLGNGEVNQTAVTASAALSARVDKHLNMEL